MKVLLAKYEVASFIKNLRDGLNENGVDVDTLYVREHPFYDTLNTNFLFRLYKWSNRLREGTSRHLFFRKVASVLLDSIVAYVVVFYVAVKYEVVIFTYAASITNTKIEKLIYDLFGVKVFYVFLGSEVRPPFLSNKYFSKIALGDLSEMSEQTLQIEKNVRRLEQEGAVIISYLPYSQFLTKPFIDILQFGFPIAASEDPNPLSCTIPRIVHIPSAKGVKRTEKVSELFGRLEREFQGKITTKILYDISNIEVRKELSRSDIILTEWASDAPTPIIALEACAEGCVPVVCGQFAKYFKDYYGEADSRPYPYITKDKVYETLIDLLRSERKLEDLKTSCRGYASSRHGLKIVGSRFLKLLESHENFERVNPLEELYPFGSLYEEEFSVVNSKIKSIGILNDQPWVQRIFKAEISVLNGDVRKSSLMKTNVEL